MSVVDKVQHYQRSIEKYWNSEERMLHCISKLYQLPVTVQHLRDTGVGRTVNSLRKYEGGVGDAAKALVAKWKTMVANEDSSDAEDEDEACVPDVPESYDDPPESPRKDPPRYSDLSTEQDLTRHSSHESRDRKNTESDKNESSKHNTKYSLKNNSIPEVDIDKSRKSSRKHEKHESIIKKHISKHELISEKKLRNSLEESSRRNDHLRIENQVNSEIDRVTSTIEPCEASGKEDSRKRKQEVSDNNPDEIKKKRKKRKKHSDSEIERGSQSFNNSPIVSESGSSCSTGLDLLGSLEYEAMNKKNSQLCDKNHESDKDRTKLEKKNSKSRKRNGRDEESHSHNSSKSKSSQNSSSNRDRKHVKRDREVKDKKRDKEKSGNELKVKKIKKERDDDGIDSQSGTSFAEALGMCTMPPPSRKRGSTTPSTSLVRSIKAEPGTSAENKTGSLSIKQDDLELGKNSPTLLSSNVKLEPLSVNIEATLPEISPNYRPLPSIQHSQRKYEEDHTLSQVMYSKTQRTKVFSGNKGGYTNVPTLYELCIRILIENIDALEVTGGVPYYIIKPVLERANPDQLFMLEHHNPYLIEDTDALWEFHVNREFRNKKREEMESWREMYMRCLDEREAKLKALTANIKQSIDKSLPVRSTIRVNDDHQVKPPRSVLRKQAKYGTSRDLPISSSEVKNKLILGGSPNSSTNLCQPAAIARFKATTSSIGKKTKAPLMAKALQLIKGRYKR